MGIKIFFSIQFFFCLVLFAGRSFAQTLDNPLPAKQDDLHWSKDLFPENAQLPLHGENQVVVYLPQNRCELGWIKWGDVESGYKKCRILGRGETQFGSIERLQNLMKQSSHYKDWTLAYLPKPIEYKHLKDKERSYVSGTQAEACLFKPDYITNGKTISRRPRGTLGVYDLHTQASHPKYHRAKEAWGRDTKGDLIPAVKMLEVKSTEDKEFDQRDLLDRYDFYVHSHKLEDADSPIEALSTWGCPRLSLDCQSEFYAWISEKNSNGVIPRMFIYENDEKAYSYNLE